MSAPNKRRPLRTVIAILVIALILVAIVRFGVAPSLQATIVQHTYGNDVTITISGTGTLSKAEVSVYIFSENTTIRVFIINVIIDSMNYRESFPYSASVTLPNTDLPRTIEVQTFYDTGDFQFLRTHQNVSVKIVIAGAWSMGSTSFGTTEMSTELCCIQPF